MLKFKAGFAVVALTLSLAVPAAGVAAPAASEPVISINSVAPQRFELVYSGTKFTSRDQIESDLLLSAAQLALAHNSQWFVLLAMTGERSDVHPPRRNPSFGARYGHWQPHWNYHLSEYGWQWWHPEWGAEFWTNDVDPSTIHRFEVHAMIDLGENASRLDEDMRFSAKDVVRDLGHPAATVVEHPKH